MFNNQRQLPNSTGVLVLGICSIVGCFCYGIPGLICGVIALILAVGARKVYEQSPDAYTVSSFKNLNAGRVCAIIGTIISAIGTIFLIIGLLNPNPYGGYWGSYYNY
ncbi:MAG: hypothetical protein IM638_10930 [Bacteroidetes bacterium]|nr:hypothetical protein [Bacteroidota bacterium]